MACDLSGLDFLVIQIDGIHMDDDLILVAAIGVDANGDKHPRGLAAMKHSMAVCADHRKIAQACPYFCFRL